MADQKAGAPPPGGDRAGSGKQRGPGGGPGGGGPGGGRGGGDRRGPGGPGGQRRDDRKGGKGRPGQGAARPARAELYETLKELTRGGDFRIDKFVAAEKGTHRPVKTEYRLTREGLKDVHVFQRLSDAQAAAVAPLPEPEPEPEIVAEIEAAAPEHAGEMEADQPSEDLAEPAAPAEHSGESTTPAEG